MSVTPLPLYPFLQLFCEPLLSQKLLDNLQENINDGVTFRYTCRPSCYFSKKLFRAAILQRICHWNLLVVSEVFEKIMYDQLYKYLENFLNQLLLDYSDFKKKFIDTLNQHAAKKILR